MNDVQRKSMKATLPGPKAKALIERDAKVVSPSYVRDYPFVMSHGRGAEAWDVDGNRFVDFAAGIAVCSTGHSHPAVVAAIQEAAKHFLHISCDYWHEGQVQLAETMARLDPVSGPAMTFFANSGSEAVEAAIKLARHVSRRSRIIGFLGAFHGRTMGSLSVTASKYTQQRGFFPTMPGVVHVPYPNPYRPLFAGADQGQAVISYIETLFERNIPPDEVAAILVEPIQGEGGYVVPPEGFLAGLRALCDKHGIYLIFDEVQAGIGRTGKMFAWQNTGVRPDIITLAKGIGSGLPIGVTVGRQAHCREVVARLACQHVRRQSDLLRGGACDAETCRGALYGERGPHGAARDAKARGHGRAVPHHWRGARARAHDRRRTRAGSRHAKHPPRPSRPSS